MSTAHTSTVLSPAGRRFGTSGPARSLGDRLVGAAAGVLRDVAAWHRRRQTERELSALSDADLKDIGVGRSDIPFVARELETAERDKG